MIDFTHWLAAIITHMKIIGRADNPVRQVLHAGVEFRSPTFPQRE
jgi:hypothetical protein